MRYRPIRRNSEFGRVYARGKSYVNQALVLYVLKTRGKKTRVGLTATKKIGHAVQRNRARRVMKAAIDEHLDYNIGGYDLVFVARGMTPRLKSWQLSAIVAKLFAQAGLPDKAKRPIAAILKYLTLVHDEILEKYPAGQLPPVDMITFRTADELAPFLKEPLSEGWKSVHELPKIGVFDKF